jgi:ribosome-binding protein aMBF1 (putative translation factor)
MTSKNVRRVVNTRKLTSDEAAEARRLRDAVEKDKAEIVAEGRRLLAERRRHQAAVEGARTLGQTIRAAREAHGLTQADLAARAHVA